MKYILNYMTYIIYLTVCTDRVCKSHRIRRDRIRTAIIIIRVVRILYLQALVIDFVGEPIFTYSYIHFDFLKCKRIVSIMHTFVVV